MSRSDLPATTRAIEVLLRPPLALMTRRDYRGVENLPAEGGFVVCPNHYSYLEPLVFGHFLVDHGHAPRYLGKVEVFKAPVVGAIVRGADQIPVYRESGRANDAYRAAVAAVRAGKGVAIYPEGTLTRDPDLWPMRGKTGAARVALETQCPVIPVATWGAHEVLAPGSFRLGAYDPKTGALAWWADGLPSEMKSGAVLGDGAVYVVGYSSPLNEPGQHPKLPSYADWRAAQDQDKDGRVTKAEADPTSKDYFDFIDLDHDGSVSESEWKMNEAMMAAENGLLAFKSDGTGDVTRSGLLWAYRRSIPQLPTPVLYRGVLYMINDGQPVGEF